MSGIRSLLSLARRPSNKDFLRDSSRLSVVRIVGLACVFSLQVILARLIGDSASYGEFAWGQSLLFLVGGIFALGVPTAASRFVASLSAQGKERSAGRIVRQAFFLLLSASAIPLLIACGLTLFWSDQPGSNFSREIAILAIVFSPVIPLYLLYQKLYLARRWLVLAFLPMQIFRPVLTAIVAFMIWRASGGGLSPNAALVIVVASIAVVTAPQIMLYHIRQRKIIAKSAGEEWGPGSRREKLWRASLPILASRLAGLTIEYSNVLLLGLLSGPTAAGAYFAADRLARLAAVPGPVAAAVNQARIAAAHSHQNQSELQSISTQTAHGTLWPTLGIALLLVVFAAPLLAIFNKDFADASPVLLVLVLGIITRVAAGPNSMVLFMTGNAKSVPLVLICTSFVHLALLAILVPQMGAVGAAITAALSGIMSGSWLTLIIRRKLRINTTVFTGLTRVESA